MNERKILSRLNSPFIVRLHYAFQSRKHLYLVLDFCPGGDLFYCLHRRRYLPEAEAKYYMAEIVLSIEYLHNNQVVYRDLKPENIVFDAEGHIKLTDFGLAKENFSSKSRTYSFCGSPEYMSPEMLQRRGHGQSVDIYALGALLFEMLTGLPPHYSQDRQEMFQAILKKVAVFPTYLSIEAMSLMANLLQKDPEKRMSLKEIKKHKFFAGVDWDSMARRIGLPPQRPNPRQSNFDPEHRDIALSLYDQEDLIKKFFSFSVIVSSNFLDNKHHKKTPLENYSTEKAILDYYYKPFVGFTFSKEKIKMEPISPIKNTSYNNFSMKGLKGDISEAEILLSDEEPEMVVTPKCSEYKHITTKNLKAYQYLNLQTIIKPSQEKAEVLETSPITCLLYTSPSPRDLSTSRMPSSA
eukprot:TRINITY_DN34603_c0_g1_i1.p1 TRINITY_DN34603_c0_g1~~TRINITY_DN34603_c0_g1_i1.p1  ORF type:complete len:435 (-),score=61.40 TRINITY_DN34603_c0_g1_i1:109-1335(-)